MKCRLCGSERLSDVLDLGEHYLPDFPEPGTEVMKAPLRLAECIQCGLVQLRHTVDRDLLYRHYWYRSGISGTMRKALKEVAVRAMETVRLSKGDIVLDIGASDGTFLSYIPSWCFRVAFEPAQNIETENAELVFKDYFSAELFSRLRDKARLVTSIAVFYDVDDPVAFARDVASVLAPDGVWVNQLNYLDAMFRNLSFDFIGHEHLTYWDLRTMVRCVAEAGLDVFRVEEVFADGSPLNGGTFRVWIGHRGGPYEVERSVPEWLMREGRSRDWGFLKSVIERNGWALRRICSEKRVHVYGASTRGLTILQAYGIDSGLVELAADRDPRKWGRVMSGLGIRIVSEEESRRLRPDLYLVLPYSYIAEFMEREREFREMGGRFIVPVPEVRVV